MKAHHTIAAICALALAACATPEEQAAQRHSANQRRLEEEARKNFALLRAQHSGPGAAAPAREEYRSPVSHRAAEEELANRLDKETWQLTPAERARAHSQNY